MKKIVLFFTSVVAGFTTIAQEGSLWTPVTESAVHKDLFTKHIRPDHYQLFQLNEPSLQRALLNSPSERRVNAGESSFIVSVPIPGGSTERYRVVEAPVMDAALAARFPAIKSYTGKGLEHPNSTIRFDASPAGFHGMILSADRPTIYIDPLDRANKYYIVFSRAAAGNGGSVFHCLTDERYPLQPARIDMPGPSQRGADDGQLRTYRLALACTGEYAQYFLDGAESNDTERKAKVLAAMNTLLTRTNGIYERDFGIRLNLIANNDALIYLDAAIDPWTSEYNITTQQTIDAVIGNANYDIGHLVHQGPDNGNAGCVGCVCVAGQKGSGFTSYSTPDSDPFVIDYTAHEMGHQFGANHTFSFSTEGFGANMEPGSGSTIMGYAGITGPTTDVQPHSDDYFHAKSIEQVTDYIKGSTGGSCAVAIPTGNHTPVANAGPDYIIPQSTPFMLTGSGSDADVSDILTYTWEQCDTFATGSSTVPSPMSTSGPQFRSMPYSMIPMRSFPCPLSTRDGTNRNQWEVLPAVTRTLNFRLTVRDNHPGGGSNSSDDMQVSFAPVGPFAVVSPNTATTWTPGTSQTITWIVNGSDAAPVNCTQIRISLSTDGGYTFPIVLADSTPNDGSESIIVPDQITSRARIKIEPINNIFFDISDVDFTIDTAAQPSDCVTAYEANETQGAAAPVPVNTGFPAAIGSSTDKDWYSFTVSAASNLSISLANLPGDYDIVLYDSSGTELARSENGGTSSEMISRGNVAAGTYYLQVYGYNGAFATTCYTLNIGAMAVTGCISPYDNSNNDSFAGAPSIPLNTNITGLINPGGDNDYYQFTIANSGDISILLSSLPDDYDIRLYNSDQAEVAVSLNGGTSNEIINYTATPGTYYIRVYGYNNTGNTTSCYSLQVAAGTASRGASPVITVAPRIAVYPNPTSNMLNVNIAGTASRFLIRVLDMNGRMLIRQQAVKGNTLLDVQRFANGVYMIVVTDEKGRQLYQSKFMKR